MGSLKTMSSSSRTTPSPNAYSATILGTLPRHALVQKTVALVLRNMFPEAELPLGPQATLAVTAMTHCMVKAVFCAGSTGKQSRRYM
jgi:hypothetical protein